MSKEQLVDYTHDLIYRALNPALKSSVSYEPIYNAPSASNDAFLKATETRYGKSSVLLGNRAFEYARIVRIIRFLPPIYRSWIKHRHCSHQDWESISQITTWIYDYVLQVSRSSGVKIYKKSSERLKPLCFLIVQTEGADRKAYSHAELSKLLGVNKKNFSRDWLGFLKQIQEGLSRLDQESVDHFWKVSKRKNIRVCI